MQHLRPVELSKRSLWYSWRIKFDVGFSQFSIHCSYNICHFIYPSQYLYYDLLAPIPEPGHSLLTLASLFSIMSNYTIYYYTCHRNFNFLTFLFVFSLRLSRRLHAPSKLLSTLFCRTRFMLLSFPL